MLSIKVFFFVLTTSLFLGLCSALAQKTSISGRDEKRAYADSLLQVSSLKQNFFQIVEAYFYVGGVE